MNFIELHKELRKLKKAADHEISGALLQIFEFKMTDFKSYIDQRFSSIQWTIGLGFTLLGILIVLMKLI